MTFFSEQRFLLSGEKKQGYLYFELEIKIWFYKMEQYEFVARYRKIRNDIERTRFDYSVINSVRIMIDNFCYNINGDRNFDDDIFILDTLNKYPAGEIINLLKSKYPNRYFRTSINMPNGKFSSFFVDELNELELNVKNMCQKLDTV